MIPEALLLKYDATQETVASSETIFAEKTRARFFYQIKSGEVKMFNTNEQGKEFVQGIFYDGDSFGEPPLLGEFPYPAAAVAVRESVLYKLTRKQLFELLTQNPDIHLKVTKALAKRLFYKATILKEISVHTPEHRILALIDFLKSKYGSQDPFQVELTRQQIADLTGLRVETVIRAVKQLEQEEEIKIINRKVFR